MIERDQKNRLTPDADAALAIRGMGPAEITEQIGGWQQDYYHWLGVAVDDDGMIIAVRPWHKWRKLQRWLAGEGFTISRIQVAVLARWAAKSITDQRAAAIREESYQEYLRLMKESRQMVAFLGEHFPHDLTEAQAVNRPLSEVLKEIMLRAKGGT